MAPVGRQGKGPAGRARPLFPLPPLLLSLSSECKRLMEGGERGRGGISKLLYLTRRGDWTGKVPPPLPPSHIEWTWKGCVRSAGVHTVRRVIEEDKRGRGLDGAFLDCMSLSHTHPRMRERERQKVEREDVTQGSGEIGAWTTCSNVLPPPRR